MEIQSRKRVRLGNISLGTNYNPNYNQNSIVPFNTLKKQYNLLRIKGTFTEKKLCSTQTEHLAYTPQSRKNLPGWG